MKLTKLKRLRAAIEETSEGLTDEAAAYVPELFPMWKTGRESGWIQTTMPTVRWSKAPE